MTDWIVWPIFLIQLLALLVIFAKKNAQLFKLNYKIVGMIIILLCNVAIVVSLVHDSSTPIHLYF